MTKVKSWAEFSVFVDLKAQAFEIKFSFWLDTWMMIESLMASGAVLCNGPALSYSDFIKVVQHRVILDWAEGKT